MTSRPYLTYSTKKKQNSDWNSRLRDACRAGDIKAAKLAISNGAKHWHPAFFEACQSGSIDVVKLIISARTVHWDYYWDGGMYYAAVAGHLNVIQFLILRAAQGSEAPKDLRVLSMSPLDLINEPQEEVQIKPKHTFNWNYVFNGACQSGHMDVIQFVISKGASDWFLGFQGACCGGHMSVVQFMVSRLQNNSNTYWKPIWKTGLKSASSGGHINIAKFMISKAKAAGTFIDAYDWDDALVKACSGGHIEMVQFLISKGACDWTSGLQYAFLNKNTEIVSLMISKAKGASCLEHYYAWCGQQRHEVYQLLYLGVDLDRFSKISGYEELQTLVSNTKQSILQSRMMLPDLLGIVSRYIIL